MTRLEHLASIAGSGLLCDRSAQAGGLIKTEIGNLDIKARRLNRAVPNWAGAVVADFVPFYFAPRSPCSTR